jgi:hypothetical protein
MQATDLDQVTNEIAAISVDAEDFSPQYALVQNPFNIPIERVVAAAYDIPIYTDSYGFWGGMTVEGTQFHAAEYDYGRENKGLGGRLWIGSHMEYTFSGHMNEVHANPGGWLIFDFNSCCNCDKKTYEETITDFIEALGRSLHMRPAEITFKNVLAKYYRPEDTIIMGTLVQPADDEMAEAPVVARSAVSQTLTFVPNPFKTSPAELALILYPLYIEDELLGFTIKGDNKTLYQLRHGSTWRCTKKINNNLPSLYVNDHKLKGLPAGGGGYFVIDGTPDLVAGVVKRISKLTSHTFPVIEYSEPVDGLYFPVNAETYEANVTL